MGFQPQYQLQSMQAPKPGMVSTTVGNSSPGVVKPPSPVWAWASVPWTTSGPLGLRHAFSTPPGLRVQSLPTYSAAPEVWAPWPYLFLPLSSYGSLTLLLAPCGLQVPDPTCSPCFVAVTLFLGLAPIPWSLAPLLGQLRPPLSLVSNPKPPVLPQP